jgi:hypothetical protein
MSVLKTIDWEYTKFDVICVETDPPLRPKGYQKQVTAYLAERGYKLVCHGIGRNSWFTRNDFIPSMRGTAKYGATYRGARRVFEDEEIFLCSAPVVTANN